MAAKDTEEATREEEVEAGLAQDPGLTLLGRLAPDELLDVGMVHVEHDHLGRTTRCAA